MIPEKWQIELKKMIDGEDISPEFEEYFNNSEECQEEFQKIMRDDKYMQALSEVILEDT